MVYAIFDAYRLLAAAVGHYARPIRRRACRALCAGDAELRAPRYSLCRIYYARLRAIYAGAFITVTSAGALMGDDASYYEMTFLSAIAAGIFTKARYIFTLICNEAAELMRAILYMKPI